jgi:hypothetical protein
MYRNSNNDNLKNHYKLYCRTLSGVIKAAKRMFYDKLITNSNNKTRTTWNIVKSITGKRTGNKSVQPIYIDDICTETDNNQVIADVFQQRIK